MPDGVLLERKPRTWHCPNCQAAARTVTTKVPWHHCKGNLGLFAPLVADDAPKTRVVPVDREDYVAGELVQTDGEGRPVMALNVERADGSNDRVVYAPTATASAEVVAEVIEEAASSG